MYELFRIVNIIRYHYFTIKYVESTSIKLKKFDKKMALYQGIERKYFNSTVKLPVRLIWIIAVCIIILKMAALWLTRSQCLILKRISTLLLKNVVK